MGNQETLEKLIGFIKANTLPIILGIIGFSFISYGIIKTLPSGKQNDTLTFDSKETISPQENKVILQDTAQDIAIDIEGAVIHPGVYHLQQDARIQDVLAKAGGLTKDANREVVAKQINLAAKIPDGGKIYIPFQNESTTGSVTSQNVLGDSSTIININTASAAVLDGLPGIGSVTAGKIINGRPYSAIEDLLGKKIVSQKVFDQIKEKISVN